MQRICYWKQGVALPNSVAKFIVDLGRSIYISFRYTHTTPSHYPLTNVEVYNFHKVYHLFNCVGILMLDVKVMLTARSFYRYNNVLVVYMKKVWSEFGKRWMKVLMCMEFTWKRGDPFVLTLASYWVEEVHFRINLLLIIANSIP